MAVVSSSVGLFLLGQTQTLSSIRPPIVTFRLTRHLFPTLIRASAITTVQTKPDPIVDGRINTGMNILACPICYNPFIQNGDTDLTVVSKSGSSFQCCTCKKDYFNNDVYLDLTVSSGSKAYGESVPISTELFRSAPRFSIGICFSLQKEETLEYCAFHQMAALHNITRNPLVSFLYERGWRQNFIWGGFPGPEKEFEMARSYLQPTVGGAIVDASCGSGMFSRLFSKSGMYLHVVALDFSENMLRQCDEFIKKDNIPTENLTLVRADISRLPFVSSSIDAVHAGAALHCWPSPSSAVAEISRILRPGGVFVATTFILDVTLVPVPILRILSQYIAQASSNRFYISERELEDLCKACGLVGFTCVRNGFFVMISATKPS